MPTYEYVCTSCGYQFEKVQRFSDAPVAVCPECAAPVRRVFHPVGVIFKGSGWYITDSRKQSGASPASPAKPEPAPAAKTDTASNGAEAPKESKAETAVPSSASKSAAE